MTEFEIQHLGLIRYGNAWDLQKELLQKRIEGAIADQLLICEHEPVYTLGKSADANNLLVNPVFLKNIGAEVFQIERGGDITFHGPGQLVGYPILNLNDRKMGIRTYVDLLEESLIQTLLTYGIKTQRIEGLTGIWLIEGAPRKIAAIGIKVSRWVTMHGFALNVSTDLSYFNHIVPCGITDKGVTSISKELGRKIPVSEVAAEYVKQFEKIFNTEKISV
ncbi:MAG: lipoyl(octanoyl) transferase LipB [Bacteroidetes bacterium]|nr:lipoyl(octanoyl) transferase LipB [Bacteroidota bacterium]